MSHFDPHTFWEGSRNCWLAVCIGLVLLMIAHSVVARMRWTQNRPMIICLILTIFAHVLLIASAYLTHFFDLPPKPPGGEVIQVSLSYVPTNELTDTATESPEPTTPNPSEVPRSIPDLAPPDVAETEAALAEPENATSDSPALPTLDPATKSPADISPDAVVDVKPEPEADANSTPPPLHNDDPVIAPLEAAAESPNAPSQTTEDTADNQERRAESTPQGESPLITEQSDALRSATTERLPTEESTSEPEWLKAAQLQPVPQPSLTPSPSDHYPTNNWRAAESESRDINEPHHQQVPIHQIPGPYRMRVAAHRVRSARERGATEESEIAVTRGLDWLARHQEQNGSWSAYRWGAGRGSWVEGKDRGEAGLQSDCGITGLSLLAMLAAGHDHRRGNYHENVQHGLHYLVKRQAPNGSLGGGAGTYAAMYCHAMATTALAEAIAMTGDPQWAVPLQRAIQYTLAAQHPTTGGWRYQPGDRGDLSQFGWQAMALTAAQHAGIPTPPSTRAGMGRFLDSVQSHTQQGLASYRPGEQPTPTMTAEALACRRILDQPWSNELGNLAKRYLMESTPSTGRVNLYYWYYATLALSFDQDRAWARWNRDLQSRLIPLQVREGPDAGSWHPNTVWGAHGGRVYSTAMATLCLEVYYRYLPSASP